MPTILMDRRLERITDKELARHWYELAALLSAKVNPQTGQLPPRYAEMYERVRAEYARRGVQLMLF